MQSNDGCSIDGIKIQQKRIHVCVSFLFLFLVFQKQNFAYAIVICDTVSYLHLYPKHDVGLIDEIIQIFIDFFQLF